jgi:16S rRNA (cytidine1402-2'-O)-methyltransferase
MPDRDSRGSELGSGVLYVVATPIGNLEDITERAVKVLKAVRLIAAEDTRRTRALLGALGLPARELLAYHDHNERELAERLVERLRAGHAVALVSDAGTPLLADPGFALVSACYRAGVPVRPVPGVCAITCALSVCPLPTRDFRFAGFLPARAAARRERLRVLLERDPLVFYEAPHRMLETLAELEALAPERRVFIGREMTKRFESYLCDVPARLAAQLAGAEALRGEFVVVVEAPSEAPGASLSAERVLAVLGRELKPAQAARLAAELTGRKRRELYEQLTGRTGEPG